MVTIAPAMRRSVYGQQPKSLNINWMKFDVSDVRVDKQVAAAAAADKENQPIRLSPLRRKLRERADQVLEKRQLLTRHEIERRIEEARLRREHASQEAVIRRVQPKAQRDQEKLSRETAQAARHNYLSELARKRQAYEESILNGGQASIKRIREREVSMNSMIAEADERSEHESNCSKRGLEQLAQMNTDLETLIRTVY